MSQPYQVLARKYRPNNFHELVGQTHVSKALINAIDHNRLHHAYLFTGTRGVGKTTIARILAKCLNCDTGVTSTPCGICDSCVAIEHGRFIDLIEIDAASRTKVEDTRELLDNVPYAPTQGRYKVYLIDEVHMLSIHSFNALLKTLEEPPEHVKFLLATTDPQKLPITIISRCLQFVLRPLAQEQLSTHLRNLLTQEHIEFEEPALWELAHGAKGSVRDSLSLTDQAIAFGQGRVTEQNVNEMLGLINGADLISLVADIYNNERISVATHIEKMRNQMVDASSVFDELADLLHKIALVQVVPTIDLNVNTTQADAIHNISKHISADVLQLYYEIIIKSRESIALATTPMQALEMCLLRMLAFRPLATDELIVAKPIKDQSAESESSMIDAKKDLKPLEDTPLPSNDNRSEILDKNIVETNINETTINLQSDINRTDDLVKDLYNDSVHDKSVDENIDLYVDESRRNPSIGIEAVQEPIVQEPIVQEPIVQEPIVQEPIVQEPIVQEPIVQEPIVQEPIVQEPIVQEPIVQEPIVQEPIVQSDNDMYLDKEMVSFDIDDPRTLLKVPKQNIQGEWTAEKWDYWIQQSRESEFLDSAELGFARQGVMTGDIHGESVFITNFSGENFQRLFESFEKKLINHFINASYSVQTITEDIGSMLDKTPQKCQQQRILLAKNVAIEKIEISPVVQFLRQTGKVAIKTVNLNV